MAEKSPRNPQNNTRGNSAHSPRSTRGARSMHSSGSYSFRNSYTGMPRSTRKPPAGKNGTSSARRLKKNGKPKMRLWKKFLIAIALIFATGAAVLGIAYAATEVPSPEAVALAQKTTVYYSDGTTPIGSFSGQNREIISCKALPDYVKNAVVASENRSFWSDPGIDLKGIARALFHNVTSGSRQGGSTITQQYAERYYLGETKSYFGKVKEALLALKIAQTQDKNTVLCNYMNTIYFGRGAYGIQAAAKAYFNKDAKDLSLDEAVLIAGIIPAPSAWDPAVSPESAAKRFRRVIRIMKEDRYITAEQAAQASAVPKTAAHTPSNDFQGTNGYILTMVRNELVKSKRFTADDLAAGGYKIITTLDKNRQDLMNRTVAESKARNKVPNSVEAGGLSVNSRTGGIISLYAGDDYLKKQLNNVSQATFEPGSTMKAFTLLGAIQKKCSLDTQFNGNSPRTFKGLKTPVKNFGDTSYGNVTLYKAVASSVNTVFMELNEDVTPATTAILAKSAGITSAISATSPYNTLGIDGVTLKELTQAYATFSNGGQQMPIHIVDKVNDSRQGTVYQTSVSGNRVFEPKDVALLNKALTGVITSGTGSSARSIGKTLAGKSGTANDNKAAAFVGYTPSVVTAYAIWSPASDGSAAELPTFNGYEYGHGYPTYLFTQYMKSALANTANENFESATDSGKIGGPNGTWGIRGAAASDGGNTGRNTSPDNSDANKNGNEPEAPGDRKSPGENSGGSGSGSGSGTGNGNNSGGNNSGGSDNGNGGGSSGDNNGSGNGNNNQNTGREHPAVPSPTTPVQPSSPN